MESCPKAIEVELRSPPELTPFVCGCTLSCFSLVRLFATLWTIARQAPLSMGFPRQEYWSGLPFPSPGDLPNPRIKLAFPAMAGKFFTTEPPGKLHFVIKQYFLIRFLCLLPFIILILKVYVSLNFNQLKAKNRIKVSTFPLTL